MWGMTRDDSSFQYQQPEDRVMLHKYSDMLLSEYEDDFNLAIGMLEAEGHTLEHIQHAIIYLFEEHAKIINAKKFVVYLHHNPRSLRRQVHAQGLWAQLDKGYKATYNSSAFTLDMLKDVVNSLQNQK